MRQEIKDRLINFLILLLGTSMVFRSIYVLSKGTDELAWYSAGLVCGSLLLITSIICIFRGKKFG